MPPHKNAARIQGSSDNCDDSYPVPVCQQTGDVFDVSSPPSDGNPHYAHSLTGVGGGVAGDIIISLQNLSATLSARFYRISCLQSHGGAGVGVPSGLVRLTTSPTGGSITPASQADVPKKVTSYPDSSIQFRSNVTPISGTLATRQMVNFGGMLVPTAGQSGDQYIWEAKTPSEEIVLLPGQSMCVIVNSAGSSLQDIYWVGFDWKELV